MSSAPPPSSTSRTADWGRTGERGSAFRGLSKGRGTGRGRGRGAPRGGGGGRGGRETSDIPSAAPTAQPSKTNADKPVHASLPEKPNAAPSSATQRNSTRRASRAGANTEPDSNTSKPNPSRKPPPSRGVPTVVVDASSASESTHSSRPTNRRRRSHNQGKSQANNNAHHSSDDSAFLRPQKAQLAPRPLSMPPKDAPPHLVPMKTDIDALVERVRAVAMGAENRPTTPGSHIDWAGDEDDSLPDLDDWGVTTTSHSTSSAPKQSDLISPIMMDGLRSLPDPVTISTSISSSPSPRITPELPGVNGTIGKEAPDTTDGATAKDSMWNKPAETATPKVHDSALSSGKPPLDSHKKTASHDAGPNIQLASEPKSSIPEGISVDSVADQPAVSEEKEDEGLSASIHAPKNPSTSPPSTSPPRTRFPHPHQPRNNRFQTSQDFASSQSAPSFHRYTRSGSATPVGNRFNRGGGPINGPPGGANATHNRTHSTPPRVHASRPVITGDAISRLARTIGTMSSHVKSTSVSVTAGAGAGGEQ